MVKSIKDELRECLRRIADNHGVLIQELNIEWIDFSDVGYESFIVNKLNTTAFRFITPMVRNDS